MVHENIIAEASRTSVKKIKVKSEVSVRTYQTYTGTYVSRLAAETDYTACHQGKNNVQILGEKQITKKERREKKRKIEIEIAHEARKNNTHVQKK